MNYTSPKLQSVPVPAQNMIRGPIRPNRLDADPTTFWIHSLSVDLESN